MQPSILIADDDTVLSTMLSEYLQAEGFDVELAVNGLKALDMVRSKVFDLIVLDIMMPVLDGIETLKQLRATAATPVIMLTARGDDLDRIIGLELGADDYLAKPCNPRELLARIKAVLRRSHHKPDSNLPLTVGDISLDPRSRAVLLGTAPIALTQTEFDLLHLLLLSPGEVISKATLSLDVLGKPLSQWDRSIDVHVSNLRKKIAAADTLSVERIRTLRGSGYLYVVHNSAGTPGRPG